MAPAKVQDKERCTVFLLILPAHAQTIIRLMMSLIETYKHAPSLRFSSCLLTVPKTKFSIEPYFSDKLPHLGRPGACHCKVVVDVAGSLLSPPPLK